MSSTDENISRLEALFAELPGLGPGAATRKDTGRITPPRGPARAQLK